MWLYKLIKIKQTWSYQLHVVLISESFKCTPPNWKKSKLLNEKLPLKKCVPQMFLQRRKVIERVTCRFMIDKYQSNKQTNNKKWSIVRKMLLVFDGISHILTFGWDQHKDFFLLKCNPPSQLIFTWLISGKKWPTRAWIFIFETPLASGIEPDPYP